MDFQKIANMSTDINCMIEELMLMNPNGQEKFKLNVTQQKILDNVNKHQITNAYVSRQSGSTTFIALHALQQALFNYGKRIVVLSTKMDSAYEINERIKYFFEQLKPHFNGSVDVVISNKGRLEFSNKSEIIFSSALSSTIKGKTASFIYLDCLDYISKKDYDEFMACVLPTLCSTNGKLISVNTGIFNGHFSNWENNINVPYTDTNNVNYIKVADDLKKFIPIESWNRQYLLTI